MGIRKFIMEVILFWVIVIFGAVLASCSKNSGTQEMPVVDKTPMAVSLPEKATETEVPATATSTEVPVTSTSTEVPPTVTPELTATPNFYNFAEFTPEPATINQANWNGVNFKLAKIEYSLKMTPLDPSEKSIEMGQGKKTANAYFITDHEGMFNLIGNETFISVTFSDGEKEVSWNGIMKDKGQPSVKLLRGLGGGGKTEGWGEAEFVFNIPVNALNITNENMKITQIKIAASKSVKNDAVTLYER